MPIKIEELVEQMKSELQDEFDRAVADAVAWFCKIYHQKALCGKKYKARTGVYTLWFDKNMPEKDYWKKNKSIYNWGGILDKDLLKKEILVRAILDNDFETASKNYTNLSPWAFYFCVAFLKKIQKRIPNANVYYGVDGCLVIDPEFIPVVEKGK